MTGLLPPPEEEPTRPSGLRRTETVQPAQWVENFAAHFGANWNALIFPFSREGRAARQAQRAAASERVRTTSDAQVLQQQILAEKNRTAARANMLEQGRIREALTAAMNGGDLSQFTDVEIAAAQTYAMRADQAEDAANIRRMALLREREKELAGQRAQMKVMGELIQIPEVDQDAQRKKREEDERAVREKFTRPAQGAVQPQNDPFMGRVIGGQRQDVQPPPADQGENQFELEEKIYWRIDGIQSGKPLAKVQEDGYTQEQINAYIRDKAKRLRLGQ